MNRKPESKKQANEGEGNKTADKQYREAATDFAKSGKVEQGAKEAARAVDEDSEELERAGEESRKPSAGDLKKDLEVKTARSPHNQ
jgi:hypothetical protein